MSIKTLSVGSGAGKLVSVLAMLALMAGCGGASGSSSKSDVNLIVLKEGQSWRDVISSRSSSSASSSSSSAEAVELTDDPANEGGALWVRQADVNQNIAGFEFCCGRYDTYQKHEFTNATDDFLKLDGGFWGADIAGHLGERVFSSFGDGAEDSPDAPMGQLGPQAVGTMMSPQFEIGMKYINFLIGGGSNSFDGLNPTAVALVVDGVVVRQAHGLDQASAIAWRTWNVSGLIGKTAQVMFIDGHANDNTDSAVPYLLADEFRGANKAAAEPLADSVVSVIAATSDQPDADGESLFHRLTDANQNIAGFEFCCGKYDTYQKHGFLVTGDFIKFDGGQWASDLVNHLGERAFTSYGQGFENDQDASGSWYGWEATGTLTTPTFQITKPYINFLVGGGINEYNSERPTAVVLRVNGKIVRKATGNGKEKELSWVSWDVSSLVGHNAVVEIIDGHDNSVDDGTFPFVMADEFRQADVAAVQPSQSAIVYVDKTVNPLLVDMGDPNPFYKDGTYYIYYLANSGFHSWQLVKTKDLLTQSFPVQALSASGQDAQVDQWLGSGSVMAAADGSIHMFATGHNADLSAVESVLHATPTDNTLMNWQVNEGDTFTGSGGYSTADFRDPFVFWNADQQQYWMLITSRYQSKAAIGLYTSDNLNAWSPAAPLYTEASPLNLEVSDYFTQGSDKFIVYSDQRDASRQVKYLINQSGTWVKPTYEALDGKAYYAARTAGTASERLLFGWVADKAGRTDSGNLGWGGDLMVHQVAATATGDLAVKMPEKIKQGLASAMSTESVWSDSGLTGDMANVVMPASARFALDVEHKKNRLSLTLTSANANAVAGLVFRNETSGSLAFIKIDGQNQQAKFYFDGNEADTNAPSVALPLSFTEGVKVDLFLDPEAGVGAIYLNDLRALSFRFYGLSGAQVGIYSTADAVNVEALARYKQ